MSQQQATSPVGPRPIDGDDTSVAAQRRPTGPVFWVFERWCCAGSPLTPRARHVLVHIAKRLQADADGRQVAFIGEGRLVAETGLSQSSVRRSVRELRSAGVITTSLGGVTRGHAHRCNEFELIG